MAFTARRVIEDWTGFYNTERPHMALGGRTPAEAYRGETPVEMWTSRQAVRRTEATSYLGIRVVHRIGKMSRIRVEDHGW